MTSQSLFNPWPFGTGNPRFGSPSVRPQTEDGRAGLVRRSENLKGDKPVSPEREDYFLYTQFWAGASSYYYYGYYSGTFTIIQLSVTAGTAERSAPI